MVKFAILTAICTERSVFLQRRVESENILLKQEFTGKVSKTVETKLDIEIHYNTFGGIKELAVECCSLTEKSMPQRITNNQQRTTNNELWQK